METSDLIALSGVSAGIIGYIVGLFQYRKAQQWKRLEFVAAEVRTAFADPAVRFALQMLDWNLNAYDLRQGSDEDDLREVWIGDADLQKAMVPHPERPDGFSIIEVRIRSAFDAFFEALRRFEHFVEVALVRANDLEPHLRYWLQRLCQPSEHGKPAPVLQTLWRYVAFYQYDEVIRFVNRFEYDCRPLMEAAPSPPASVTT